MALFELHSNNDPVDPKPKPKGVKLVDKRKTLAATGAAIRPNKDLRTGEYDPKVIENIVKMAQKYGVDPYKAVAIGLQESGLGKNSKGAIGQTGEILKGGNESIESPLFDTEQMILHIKRSEERADKLGRKSFAERAQVYNGLGTVTGTDPNEPARGRGSFRSGIQTLYGMQLAPGQKVDMGKTNLYGKTVEDLMENVIKKSPEVVAIIDKYIPKKSTEAFGNAKLMPADSTKSTVNIPMVAPTVQNQ